MPTPTSQKSSHVGSSNALKVSTISEDLMITGNVTSKAEIQLDGRLQGDIRCASLVLGENSQLEGGAIAEDVVIRGRLIGSVRALRVTLQSNCHVEGDLIHQSLAIEQGAFFEGKSRHADDPLSPSQTIAEEGPADAPQLATDRSERRRDKPATMFKRSL
jgi:cytoskeletal protein CcmA (bactofilin family)